MSTQILIIDDDEDDRDLLSDGIREVDHSIECSFAINGEEALQVLRSSNIRMPDFIFLDLNMPRLNGMQTLAELKKCKDFQTIPVIIYTTSKLNEDIIQAKKLGAVHFITKPSKAVDLRKEILFVLSRNWEKAIQTFNH